MLSIEEFGKKVKKAVIVNMEEEERLSNIEMIPA